MPFFPGTQKTNPSQDETKFVSHERIQKFILLDIEDEQFRYSFARLILPDDATVNQHPCFAHVDSSIKLQY